MSFTGNGCARCSFTGIENVGLHSIGTKPCDHCGGLSLFEQPAKPRTAGEMLVRVRDAAKAAVIAWGTGQFLDERMRDLQAAIVEAKDAE